MSRNKILLSVASCVFFSALSLSPTFAVDQIAIDDGSFGVGTTGNTVTVRADFDLTELYGYQFGVSYDPAVIQINSVTFAGALPLPLDPQFFDGEVVPGEGVFGFGCVFDFGNNDPPHVMGFENVLAGPSSGIALAVINFDVLAVSPTMTTLTLTNQAKTPTTPQLKNVLTTNEGTSLDVGDGLILDHGDLNITVGESRRAEDVNGDGAYNIADPVAELNYLFSADNPEPCYFTAFPDLTAFGLLVMDYNGDGSVNIADPVASLNRLFGGGDPHDSGEGCQLFSATDGCASVAACSGP